jgi:5-methyltetrahydrofolate--homocysteine methyltransferase
MVSSTRILETARNENVDIIGLSGLITPSLDEMCHVAAEMEREGFDMPLLIGGATTSRIHTAVKIHPNYQRGQSVYVTDASRAVGVVSRLMSDRTAFFDEVKAEYATIAEVHARGQADRRRLSLEDARAKRVRLAATPSMVRPSFLGTRVIDDWRLADLVDFIDWTPFFSAWEIKGTYPLLFEDPKVGEAARALYADARAMLTQMVAEDWLTPRAVVGFWPAASDGDDIVLYADEARRERLATLHMLRQQMARASDRGNAALSDFVAPVSAGVADYVGGFAVSTGFGEDAVAERFARANDDYSKILSQSLADRLAEAFAEALHAKVRRELWGYAPNETLGTAEMIAEAYQGIRPAPGYPAQPDHTEKRTLFRLLDAENAIGIRLTESCAMWPASSVSGLYFARPESHYFGVGKIERDQIEDYAARKGLPVEEAERWLAPILAYDPLRMRQAAE